MDKEDYKAIAKINRENWKWFATKEVYNSFCKQQADYFEKTSKCEFCIGKDKASKQRRKENKSEWIKDSLVPIFQRKQFLKWCEV